jgi:hypothetical protein
MRCNFIALVSIVALAGCDSGNMITGGKEEKVTAVSMGDIDNIEGTISDEMINTDESTDEAPLDSSAPPASSVAKKKEAPKTAKSDSEKPKTDAVPAPLPAAEPSVPTE